jgi:hypothetical protein
MVAPATALLDTGRIRWMDGVEYAVYTIRQGNATMTVMLTKAEARSWIDTMADTEGKMTGLTVAPGLMNGASGASPN